MIHVCYSLHEIIIWLSISILKICFMTVLNFNFVYFSQYFLDYFYMLAGFLAKKKCYHLISTDYEVNK